MLQKHGFLLVVVTNQSGIARGFFGEEELRKVNDKMYELLKENGVLLSGVYYCPHYENGIPGSPYATVCTCRKPKPGMAFKAKEDLKLSLGASYMIGDKPADIAFGKNAGCRASILLHGGKNDENPDGLQADYDYLAQNMLLAAQWIIRNEKEGVL
jgi:D-glycero-D-manno-heptose 1,7-bisphosphate phosphatase